MIAKRVACFAGFLWELFRILVLFRLGAILLDGGVQRLSVILWCAVPQVVMPAGLFFLGLYPVRYAEYSKLLAAGKFASIAVGLVVIAALTGLVRIGGIASLTPTLHLAVTIGFTLVLLLDVMLFVFLLAYPKLDSPPATGARDPADAHRAAGTPDRTLPRS